MKDSFLIIKKFIGAWIGLPLFVSWVQAVDPLPEHIENASEEIKSAYVEQLAKKSLEERIEVGKERYETRMNFKKETIQHMRSEADERIQIIQKSRSGLNTSTMKDDSGVETENAIVFGICALLLGGMLYFRIQAKKSILDS